MSTMDEKALSHKPVEAVVAMETWKAKREISAELSTMVDAHLKRGGRIEFVPIRTADQAVVTQPLYNNLKPEHFAKSQQNAAKKKMHSQFSRDIALESGAKTYAGLKCLKCGMFERWTKTKSCIVCKPDDPGNKKKHTQTIATENRKAADIAGLKNYEGKPCRKCGEKERIVETGRCVKCRL